MIRHATVTSQKKRSIQIVMILYSIFSILNGKTELKKRKSADLRKSCMPAFLCTYVIKFLFSHLGFLLFCFMERREWGMDIERFIE